ncbi:alkaline phosphatase [Sphingobacterium sp. UT-1RO-CII-1]|uniref:alkaline phosphatase n=1 Tax=Sphingobacterium sp. UT-1RO-CII-1 TaxID=2995225 RepID=UPI00227ABAA9|nr:alkaline phosphatase [Sphingobacterium sp. UT-1RO-CII-1]MCY4781558.1 alkaline phosphatase [Sphingobacterium sp. UT-1RO-CII-1]
MRKLFLVLAFSAATLFSFAQSTWKPKHVILVGLDGFGAYAVPKANMPNFKKLMKEGAFNLNMRSVLPSSSAVNWASMLMGASPTIHGYTEWGSQTPEIPSAVTTENDIFPSIFTLIKEEKPQSKVGAVYSWGGIGYLLEKQIVDINVPTEGDEDQTAEQTATVIKNQKPQFLFVHFDQPDGAGHKFGHDSVGYYQELERVDARLGKIISAIKDANIEDETLLIVLADHGGIEKGHGGKTMMEVRVPVVMTGQGVKTNHEVKSTMVVYDVATTIAWALGLDPHEAWRGKAITDFFK